MKKIRLNIETLSVQSYPTSDGVAPDEGTVHGLQMATILVCSGNVTCASGCSETNGVVVCKSCGPCCYE